jgi:hypothetical protein
MDKKEGWHMKRYLIILATLLLIAGCTCPAEKNRDVLARINNYEITKEEFEEEFKASGFSRFDTDESRKEFLDSLIDQKLILQEAQQKGLDKELGFLKAIERFWEQSLLKIALDKKTKEIAGSVSVKDRELSKAKESQLMEEWLNSLRKNADIKINYGLLK